MEILFLWIGLAVAIGIFAANKGRNGFGWFLLAIIISPLVAGIIVIAISNLKTEKSARTGYIECWHCAEMVKAKAKVCPHCRCDLAQRAIQIEKST